ncbi:MAG: YabP/YqfC family sporulation protein [Eubacteriales bacterium]
MKKRQESLLERAASVFDLPAQAVAGVPFLELTGDRELRIENHRGILAYSDEELHISGGIYIVKVQGESLVLRTMTTNELLITGRICAICLE